MLERVLDGRLSRRAARDVQRQRHRPESRCGSALSRAQRRARSTRAPSARIIEMRVERRRAVRLDVPRRRTDRLHAHGLDRLQPLRRRADHLSDDGRGGDHADLPAHADEPPARPAGRARHRDRLTTPDAKDIFLTLDGQEGFEISDDDRVCVRKSEERVLLVQSPDKNYFDVSTQQAEMGRRMRLALRSCRCCSSAVSSRAADPVYLDQLIEMPLATLQTAVPRLAQGRLLPRRERTATCCSTMDKKDGSRGAWRCQPRAVPASPADGAAASTCAIAKAWSSAIGPSPCVREDGPPRRLRRTRDRAQTPRRHGVFLRLPAVGRVRAAHERVHQGRAGDRDRGVVLAVGRLGGIYSLSVRVATKAKSNVHVSELTAS